MSSTSRRHVASKTFVPTYKSKIKMINTSVITEEMNKIQEKQEDSIKLEEGEEGLNKINKMEKGIKLKKKKKWDRPAKMFEMYLLEPFNEKIESGTRRMREDRDYCKGICCSFCEEKVGVNEKQTHERDDTEYIGICYSFCEEKVGVTEKQTHERDDTEYKEMQELDHLLRCKVCLDSDACVIFFPCRHMATCEYCEGFLERCPVCRCFIEEAVKVNED